MANPKDRLYFVNKNTGNLDLNFRIEIAALLFQSNPIKFRTVDLSNKKFSRIVLYITINDDFNVDVEFDENIIWESIRPSILEKGKIYTCTMTVVDNITPVKIVARFDELTDKGDSNPNVDDPIEEALKPYSTKCFSIAMSIALG